MARWGADYNIYNSVIHGNDAYQLFIDTENSGNESTVNISHTLIEGGYDGIGTEGNSPIFINWLEGNLDCDPMVCEDYTPQSGSPLIDAGTMELPYDIELPEFDVLGNPRIYGNGVDIGAIEWQGTPINLDDIAQKPMELMVYPNPLISSQLRDGKAKIMWVGDQIPADMQFDIYNVRGQRVRELKIENVKLKINTVNWDLRDSSGSKVSSGVYFVRMKGDGVYYAQRKVTVCW